MKRLFILLLELLVFGLVKPDYVFSGGIGLPGLIKQKVEKLDQKVKEEEKKKLPSITLISPNGGETWNVGTKQRISWTWTGDIPYIFLAYFKNNDPDTLEAITLSPIANTGSYEWTIPNDPSTKVKVVIAGYKTQTGGDILAMDMSDNFFTITTVNAPTSPSNLIATAISSSQINLSWQDNSNNETGFKIERKIAGGSYSQITTVGANVTSYQNTGLSPNTTYYYRVRAYNDAGNSAYSNEAYATTYSGGGQATTYYLCDDGSGIKTILRKTPGPSGGWKYIIRYIYPGGYCDWETTLDTNIIGSEYGFYVILRSGTTTDVKLEWILKSGGIETTLATQNITNPGTGEGQYNVYTGTTQPGINPNSGNGAKLIFRISYISKKMIEGNPLEVLYDGKLSNSQHPYITVQQ